MNNIDQSLNLLKDLQVRLKYRQGNQPSFRTHTQQDQHVFKRQEPWGERLATAYENVEEKMQVQNRQLKKHINKLIRMNDYLKNQLVKGEHYSDKFKKGTTNNSQIEMLKIEIQYLKELNRQKQLKIEILSQKKTKKQGSCSSPFKPGHSRHNSKLSKKSGPGKCQVLNLGNSFRRKESSTTQRKSFTTRKGKCSLCYA